MMMMMIIMIVIIIITTTDGLKHFMCNVFLAKIPFFIRFLPFISLCHLRHPTFRSDRIINNSEFKITATVNMQTL
jgi:hypothetical protein